MRLVEVKSSKGGRYAYMDTESSHLNCIQIRKILPHILYHITLGWEPCLCDLISVASTGRDWPATVIPTPTLFYVVKENTRWLYMCFPGRFCWALEKIISNPFYPQQVFSIQMRSWFSFHFFIYLCFFFTSQKKYCLRDHNLTTCFSFDLIW